MGTTADKLQKILDSKAAIKAAIARKTSYPEDNIGDVMANYAGFIDSISSPDYEVVNIKLTTNQGTDYGFETVSGFPSSYLYDANGNIPYYMIQIQVDGESEARKFPWIGNAITTAIPAGKKYTINVNYMNQPLGPVVYAFPTFRTKGYTAVAGMTKNIYGVFSCEKITVKLVNEQQVAITGQDITIQTSKDTYTYKNTASDFVFAIPTGSEYTISFSDRSGYDTPASQTYTANQTTREITGIYKIQQLGVFILDGSNNRVNIDDWSASMGAIGIAVVTSDCSFVVYPGGFAGTSTWSASTGQIANLSSLNGFETIPLAKKDFNGLENTTKILLLGDTKSPAYLCSQKTINGQSCYLPSVGEIEVVRTNIDRINIALKKIGKDSIAFTSYVWTSSYRGLYGYFWYQYNNGNYVASNKYNAYYLPIAELKSTN